MDSTWGAGILSAIVALAVAWISSPNRRKKVALKHDRESEHRLSLYVSILAELVKGKNSDSQYAIKKVNELIELDSSRTSKPLEKRRLDYQALSGAVLMVTIFGGVIWILIYGATSVSPFWSTVLHVVGFILAIVCLAGLVTSAQNGVYFRQPNKKPEDSDQDDEWEPSIENVDEDSRPRTYARAVPQETSLIGLIDQQPIDPELKRALDAGIIQLTDQLSKAPPSIN